MVLGAIYSLMATGITLVYSILRVINFSQGELFTLGGYALYYFSMTLKLPDVFGLLFVALVGYLCALAIERAIIRDVYKPALERPSEYALMATFALSILLQNLMLNVFGYTIKTPPAFLVGGLRIMGYTLTWDRILAAVLASVVYLALYLFIKTSWTGKIWQAYAQNRTGVSILGAHESRIGMHSFSVAGMLSALTGALIAPVYSVYPNAGTLPLIIGFVIIVIGGLGSIEGAFIGGLIVGLTQSLVTGFSSAAYGYASIFLIMIFFLLIRPRGILGEVERIA
ncbi:hypothetical protein B9Q02_06545 [Candidatus Marsarchaeota G1 archaeon BE_D]|uniref:Branched-chain amino acid ABC transporter permease n=1 Tax=Candidatus Marsarchaeota G1 archaeon BE_D TaxID=1978156 RepID=A0A2R6AG73_9ARCH|nr:MAG: hypothetical protein B9Q02_06545 [Candidatus Marsarchaeota G1 archaeon BE_D]